MSTIDQIKARQNGADSPTLYAKGLRVAIAVAEWNREVTGALLQGAVETLQEVGAETPTIVWVPGAFELTNAATRLKMGAEPYDAIIVIGCVVRGDTPHFDYICQGVSYGISRLNTLPDPRGQYSPVIFGVLTTETMAQAMDRAGGSLGNKGAEAAETAIKTIQAFSAKQ